MSRVSYPLLSMEVNVLLVKNMSKFEIKIKQVDTFTRRKYSLYIYMCVCTSKHIEEQYITFHQFISIIPGNEIILPK